MSDEFVFSPSEVTLANISELSRLETVIEERRICELYELADEIARESVILANEGMSAYEFLSLVSENIFGKEYSIHRKAMVENISNLTSHVSSIEVTDKAIFCDLLLKRMSEFGVLMTESDFLSTDTVPETFVYVKNSFADEAYDVFSQDFSDPRVAYASSFKEALRLTAENMVGYCLLPLEERGARIPSVEELLFKGDFKINSVTPVFGFDGSADMKYALVSRAFTIPKIKADDDRYLEIRIGDDAQATLAELLSVAKFYGVDLYRINTITFDTDDDKKVYYSIVFRDEGKDFSALLTYLTLFSSSFAPVGIYKNLE